MSKRILSVALSALLGTASTFETVTSADGLVIDKIVALPCSRRTRNNDKISVHYRGTLLSNGFEFDDSYGRGDPITFTLGQKNVIAGWDLGLLDMCIGDERNLTIPAPLAYGASGVGQIPPNSVLRFETKLVAIQGVEAEPADIDVDPVSSDRQKGPDAGPTSHPQPQGECRLLGPFALVVQAALGLIALLSLVFKRWREHPRRPLQVWVFDASKQVVGTAMLHVLNLAMSMLSSQPRAVNVTATTHRLVVEQTQSANEPPNPCSFYLLNLAIDTTIGIPILVIFLRVLHAICLRTPLASPPESIRSGNYGQPPRVSWWIKQCLIYFVGLFGMKFFVFFLFAALPWLAFVGDWALRWTEGDEGLQIAFVMFICPVALNAVQYYVIDCFIIAHGGGEGEGRGESRPAGERRGEAARGGPREAPRGTSEQGRGQTRRGWCRGRAPPEMQVGVTRQGWTE